VLEIIGMAHIVETAKSGRARCRTCGEGILKDDVRFGEEVANAFSESGGTTFQWHHLRCAAKKKPSHLREALKSFAGEVPDREEIEMLIAENEPKQKPSAFPYAERAPSARSHCGRCQTVIAKGGLRVAVPREQEGPPSMMPPAPRYLHAACAKAALDDDPEMILGQIRQNSRGLTPEDLDQLARAFH
jgi:Poly(ADP-ribose) polymerase and DNA-Ligase Zn-finger region